MRAAAHIALVSGAKSPAERVKDAGAWRLLCELSAEYHVPPEHVLSPIKTPTVRECRDRFLLILRDTVGFSLPELGRLVGRDHTSVLAAIRRARARLEAEHAA